MFTKILSRSILAAVFCFFLFSSAKADPLVIQSGVVSVRGHAVEVSWGLTAPGFSMGSFVVVHPTPIPPCAGGNCVSGSVVNLSYGTGQIDWTEYIQGAWFHVDGTLYTITSPFAGLSNLRMLAGDAMLPDGDNPTIVLQTPFTLVAYFSGLAPDGTRHQVDVTGFGIATLTLNRYVDILGRVRYQYQDVRYSITPVPEPATVFLLISGLGVLLFRRYGLSK